MRRHKLRNRQRHCVGILLLTIIARDVDERLHGVRVPHRHHNLRAQHIVSRKSVGIAQQQVEFSAVQLALLRSMVGKHEEARQHRIAVGALTACSKPQQFGQRLACVVHDDKTVGYGRRLTGYALHLAAQTLRPKRQSRRLLFLRGRYACNRRRRRSRLSATCADHGEQLFLHRRVCLGSLRQSVVDVGHSHEHLRHGRSELVYLKIHSHMRHIVGLSHKSQLLEHVLLHVGLVAAVDSLLQSLSHHVHILHARGLKAVRHDVVDELQTGMLLAHVVGIAHSAEHLYAHIGVVRQRIENVYSRRAPRQGYLLHSLRRVLLYGTTTHLRHRHDVAAEHHNQE